MAGETEGATHEKAHRHGGYRVRRVRGGHPPKRRRRRAPSRRSDVGRGGERVTGRTGRHDPLTVDVTSVDGGRSTPNCRRRWSIRPTVLASGVTRPHSAPRSAEFGPPLRTNARHFAK